MTPSTTVYNFFVFYIPRSMYALHENITHDYLQCSECYERGEEKL